MDSSDKDFSLATQLICNIKICERFQHTKILDKHCWVLINLALPITTLAAGINYFYKSNLYNSPFENNNMKKVTNIFEQYNVVDLSPCKIRLSAEKFFFQLSTCGKQICT